jgi:UDP-3-O-[3-hydroxymyristoyl] N-acetylglucosamine deacetylase
MYRRRNEHTLAASCQVQGRGYWTGKIVTVDIHPASAGTGIQLVRTDLFQRPSCPAHVDYRGDATLRTNVVSGDASFEMIEHLMAALVGLEIDNAIVEIDGQELPGLDGSSLAYVEALAGSGLVVQAAMKKRLVISEPFRISNVDGWLEAGPARSGESYFEYQLSFDDDTPIAPQAFSIELNPERFIRAVAPARTFVTQQQADAIKAKGLANHVSNRDLLVIASDGPVDNEYRFTNECARHKTLDLIGDLALCGIELVGRFSSFRGGHALNGRMAHQLATLAQRQGLYIEQSVRPYRRAA